MPDMPKFEKSPSELVERFAATLDRLPGAEIAQRRKMFGYPCAFVGGNMTTGLFADHWWVRVSPEDAATLVSLGSIGSFEPMPGRPMRGYTVLPPAVVDDDAAVAEWIQRAINYAASLPPKT